jgi:hypothetical protein
MANIKQQEEARKKRRMILETMRKNAATAAYAAAKYNHTIEWGSPVFRLTADMTAEHARDLMVSMTKLGWLERIYFMDQVGVGTKRSVFRLTKAGLKELTRAPRG